MSILTGADKRWLEKAFDMSGGYVLDFTNPSFDRFFNDYGVDIYDPRFEIYGTSKANRLRAFWDIEHDEIVGRVLLDLLESCEFADYDPIEISKGTVIAGKLAGMSHNNNYPSAPQNRIQELLAISEEKDLEKLWGPGPIRVFISHLGMHKKHAMKIKESLVQLGIASFVAHSDIEPTLEWQTEIERALFSMNIFVALLTNGFKESDWTDQEVGFALARKVPILPVSRGKVPYGFIAKIQALTWSGPSADPVALRVMEMALGSDVLNSKAKDAYIAAVSKAHGGSWASHLLSVLTLMDSLSPNQASGLVRAFNSNRQVQEAISFKERITSELNRLTERLYFVDESGKLSTLYSTVQDSEEIPF